MKRIFLFLLTNIAVLFTLGIVANVLCVLVAGTTLEQALGPEYSVIAVYAFAERR